MSIRRLQGAPRDTLASLGARLHLRYAHRMNIKEQYPDLEQWLRYGSTMEIGPATDQKIELLLGDAGGIPEEGRFYVQTPDEAFEKADSVLKQWRTETKKTLDSLVTGEFKSTNEEFIQVPGWPPERNPYYEGA